MVDLGCTTYFLLSATGTPLPMSLGDALSVSTIRCHDSKSSGTTGNSNSSLFQ